MSIEQQHIRYTVLDLLHDESFLSAEKDSSGSSRKYWDDLASKDKHFAVEVDVARAILKDLRTKSDLNRLPLEEELHLWEKIENSKNKYNRRKKYRIVKWICTSTAVFIFIAGLLYPLLYPADIEINYSVFVNKINSENEDITLILSESKSISMTGKEAEVDYQDGFVHIKTEEEDMEQKEETEELFNQLIVPKGKRSFVTLSDGTRMWVNAGTVVVYPVEFADNKREIYVEGEVFLDVTHNDKKIFLVKTNNMEIKVLGTQFNISAYKEEEVHQVTLVEGKVEIGLPDKTQKILHPKQKFIYENEKWNICEVDNFDDLAWIHGYHQYKDQTLDKIIKGLTRYYGKTISYHEDIKKYICSGKLDLKDDLDEVLTKLEEAAPVKVEYHSDGIYIRMLNP